MDADTTRTKDSYEKILSSFANGEADVLIGTQMIVKGHDFPKVTLVGILAADLSLNASDYRAGERTFQLLTQAVGRAGRGAPRGSGDPDLSAGSLRHYPVLRLRITRAFIRRRFCIESCPATRRWLICWQYRSTGKRKKM